VNVNTEQDYNEYLSKARKLEVEQQKDLVIPPDSVGNFGKQIKVYVDETGTEYDSYMIKVDLKNGWHAEYVFYKLQILYDSVKDLYILWTRYG